MTDEELIGVWGTLGPSREESARMEDRVMGWLEASRTPLWDEWLVLFRGAPVRGLAFSFAAAAALFFATPLVGLLRFLP